MSRPQLDGLSTEVIEIIASRLDIPSLCALRRTNRQIHAQVYHLFVKRCSCLDTETWTNLMGESLKAFEAAMSNQNLLNQIHTIKIQEDAVLLKESHDHDPDPWPRDGNGRVDSSRIGVSSVRSMLAENKFDFRTLVVTEEDVVSQTEGVEPHDAAVLARDICDGIDLDYRRITFECDGLHIYFEPADSPDLTFLERAYYDLDLDVDFYWGRKIFYEFDRVKDLEVTSGLSSIDDGLIDQVLDPGDCSVQLERLSLAYLTISATTLNSILAGSGESITAISFVGVHLHQSTWRNSLTRLAVSHPHLKTFCLSEMSEGPVNRYDELSFDGHETHVADSDDPTRVEFLDFSRDKVEEQLRDGLRCIMPQYGRSRALRHIEYKGPEATRVLQQVIESIEVSHR